jgi:transposase
VLNTITTHFVGLDVHQATIAIAVADPGRGDPRVMPTIRNDFKTLIKSLRRLGTLDHLVCCYEAGPTGYGLYRQLKKAGVRCVVIAPSLVPVKSGRRIKTDCRDAAKLAGYLRSGDLTAIHVPDEATEAVRDLERARDDAKRSERVARHHLSKFLLRQGRIYTGATKWGKPHAGWIAGQTFEHPASQHVFGDYREAVELATARVERLTLRLREVADAWDRAPLIKALQALRGVEMVSSVTLVAEIADFRRFASASELMSYVGLVPSENSSGSSRRLGGITRAGNGHVRRILVESAWQYRRAPGMSKALRARNEGVEPEVRAIAWKAQHRLHSRLKKLLDRGKPANQAVTAVARELVGFIWAIARTEVLMAK